MVISSSLLTESACPLPGKHRPRRHRRSGLAAVEGAINFGSDPEDAGAFYLPAIVGDVLAAASRAMAGGGFVNIPLHDTVNNNVHEGGR